MWFIYKGELVLGRSKLLEINIGDIFGDLKCIDYHYSKKDRQTVYVMKCMKCGREKTMKSSTIRIAHGIKHSACGKGLKTKNKTFYDRWQAMRSRTTNPKTDHYKDYGGRGINSDEFEYFIDFYDAMFDSFIEKAKEIGESNTSLERIDVDGNYTKENCIWIDKHDQPKNQRKTIRFIVTYPDGHEEYHENVLAFAREHGLDDQSIYDCVHGKYSQHKGYKFRNAQNNQIKK